MNKLLYRRFLLASILTVTLLLPSSPALAAIPCGELPVIPAPADMPVPMIYIELPVTLAAAMSRGHAVDRTTAAPATDEEASRAETAAMNQLRCLNYGNSAAYMGNATPQYRVLTLARPEVESDVTYIDAESVHLVQFGDVLLLEDGRLLIDFTAIVDGVSFIAGEFVFAEHGFEWYLDSAALREEISLGKSHEIEVSEKFTREVKIIEMANGDSLRFINTSTESFATITITNEAGDNVFEGDAMAEGMTGGETQNIFVAYDLKPGDYTATVTFEVSGIAMNVTIVVTDGPRATPEATPAD